MNFRARTALVVVLLAPCWFGAAADPPRLPLYRVEGDSIPDSLNGAPGNPQDGRKIMLSRQLGSCLLCHTGPFPEERFQGNIGPDLHGVGARLTPGQLRLRIVDTSRLNQDTVMPSYYRIDGRHRVAKAWMDRPMLTAGQVEDVVAFLATLRTP